MLRFQKPDPKKTAEKERLEKEAKQAHDEAIGHAQNCLRDNNFIRYKEDYERTERAVIQELILLDETETDPVRYGFKAKDIISKLRHLGALLRGVNQQAGKSE